MQDRGGSTGQPEPQATDTGAPPASASANALLHAVDRAVVAHRDAGVKGEGGGRARVAIGGALLAFRASPGAAGDVEARVRGLLEDPSGVTARRELALGVLRALPVTAMAFLQGPDVRSFLSRFVEAQLADALPAGFSSEGSHVKIEKLVKIQTDAEATLKTAVATLTSLDRLKAHRSTLMKALKAGNAKALLHPLLPPTFVDGALGELFTRAEDYFDSRTDARVVDAHRALGVAVDAARQALAAFPTEYAGWILQHVVLRAGKLADDDFATNKLAQPSRVVVSSTDKRYPLRQGSVLEIPVLVRNEGPGYAHDVSLLIVPNAPAVVEKPDIVVGRMAPFAEERVDVPFRIDRAVDELQVLLQLSWRDFDGKLRQHEHVLELRAQRADVDWDSVQDASPYSLEPCEADALVGRGDVLTRLMSALKPESAGSAIIHGQKRVGKTSIARAVSTRSSQAGWHVVVLESGDYIDASPQTTLQRLAGRLCRKLVKKVPQVASIPVPASFESLEPLIDYLDDVQAVLPGKLVFIFDEFDELPAELYARDGLGKAFFLGLRSLTSRPRIACVLVGGEKMRAILDAQGDTLNKWSVVQVDYFDREKDWAAYGDLVQKPAAGILDYTHDAVAAVFDATAGNPFFTNLVCQTIFRTALSRRDCHVTAVEVEQAVRMTAQEVESNAFQHFWVDGILGSGAGERMNVRRRVLVALADKLSTERPCSAASLAKHALVASTDVDGELRDLQARKVLKGDAAAGVYDVKVPLFLAWLRARGIAQMLATLDAPDEPLVRRRRQEELRVKSGEIVELVQKWGSYRGTMLTEPKVQAWLEQFPDVVDQRLMLRLLQNVDFFTNAFVRKKLLEINEIVRRAANPRVGARALTNRDLLVSYLDGAAKSGAHFAGLFADEAGLRAEDVVERPSLRQKILDDDGVRLVVLVDDFVGTGQSAVTGLRELHASIGDIIRTRDITVVFATIVAHKSGWEKVQALASELQFGLQAHCCEVLDETTRLFGQRSKAFPDADERQRAREIVKTKGALLESKSPLGFGNLELAVVFERGCPNNSVPILWSESVTPRWMPLFKRL